MKLYDRHFEYRGFTLQSLKLAGWYISPAFGVTQHRPTAYYAGYLQWEFSWLRLRMLVTHPL